MKLRSSGALVTLLVLSTIATAQFPDMFYYKFDEPSGTMTANLASPGVGSMQAPINGGLALGGTGQFGGGLTLSGGAGTTDFVDTGWVTALGSGSWTMSMMLDISQVAAVNPFGYFFGDSSATSFRCFTNGAAGLGNVIIRGPLLDNIIPGGANQAGPQVIAWVHDAAAGVTKGYLNGVLTTTVNQTAPNITGTANLKVAAYATSGGLPAGGFMDEFRMYGYALTDAEILQTWNVSLLDNNILNLAQSGPGIGDLAVSLTSLSSTAAEGFTFLSTNTVLPEGAGPFFGLVPVGITWDILSYPYFPGNPFHFLTSDPPPFFPQSAFIAPPGTMSALTGQSMDFVCVMLNALGGYDSKSNVARITFQ